ncbi:MAG TPA: CsbD family protein [Candidatus Angelobacter sp.]|jgi:uncharacterized protein YjbJ (UPF0337 family)|nr:CsbD family protein [Candidatus Angelobacter sp.]
MEGNNKNLVSIPIPTWKETFDATSTVKVSQGELEDRSIERRESVKQNTKDKAKGKFHEVKGRVKQKIGRATNNPNLEAEGIGEKIAGNAQGKIGQVEKVLGK